MGLLGYGATPDIYSGLLSPDQQQDMQNRTLATQLGAIGAASAPSRLPVTLGSVLGQGALSAAQAKDSYVRNILGAQALGLQNQEARVKTGLQLQAMNVNRQLAGLPPVTMDDIVSGRTGMGGGAPSMGAPGNGSGQGMPSSGGPSPQGAMPMLAAASGTAPGSAMPIPAAAPGVGSGPVAPDRAEAYRLSRLYALAGDDKAAQRYWDYAINGAGGFNVDPGTGNQSPIAGGPMSIPYKGNVATAETLGKNLQTIGPNGVTNLPGAAGANAQMAGATEGAKAAATFANQTAPQIVLKTNADTFSNFAKPQETRPGNAIVAPLGGIPTFTGNASGTPWRPGTGPAGAPAGTPPGTTAPTGQPRQPVSGQPPGQGDQGAFNPVTIASNDATSYEYNKGLVSKQLEMRDRALQSAQTAQGNDANLDLFQKAVADAAANGTNAGYFTPALGDLVAGAKSLGIDPSNIPGVPNLNAVSDIQTANKVTKLIMGEVLKRMYGSRITNADQSVNTGISPGMGLDPMANQNLVNMMRQQNAYDKKFATEMLDYEGQSGDLKGFEQKFYKANGYGPLAPPLAAAPIKGEQPAGGSPGAPAWAVKSAMGPNKHQIFFDGKSWVDENRAPLQ